MKFVHVVQWQSTNGTSSRYSLTSTPETRFRKGMAITVGNLLAVIALQRGPDHDDDGPEGYEGGSENNEGCPMPPPPPPEFEGGNHTGKPSVVVDLALGSFRFVGFVVNLTIRIGAVVAFSKVRQVLHCLQTKDKTHPEGKHHWRSSWERWTVHEKLYLCIMAISLASREILSSGPHFLRLISPCRRRAWISEILEFIQVQSMCIWSLELVLEVATFLLLAFMGTFTHSLELEVECRQREMTKKADAGPLAVHLEELLLIQTHSRKKGPGWPLARPVADVTTKTHAASSLENDPIRGEMERLLHSYFDMVAVWGHVADCTGFLTLVIFTEHTLSFCLNIFMIIATLSRFGMQANFFVSVTTASIIISKMICVAYMAQRLPDATTKLADRVQELSWKRKDVVSEEDDDENDNLTQIIDYVRSHPLTLSGLGYFTVSKATLTSISGVVVTYLVVLVQFHVQTLQQKGEKGA
ncbi:uncharacterized protein LOC110863610 isoform X2 [Folsomia candida]|uniref:uncharacterized protein LOC110863610 isoform X2 n=1 Tax=Folsomia candida TaxID=158441 RepID=UPI001604AB95|nr:uncharacterized protein LOC110863610 isoform X2 [Folsomia candida]